MNDILVAEEIRTLLDPDILSGFTLDWITSTEKTPAAGYRAVVPILTRRIGEPELQRLPNLLIIANVAVGVDNIDLPAAARHGVLVTNTPDVLTESTADLTWALILGAARRVKEGHQMLVDGWPGWHPAQLLGVELNGKTLGVIGAGRIGQAVARRAAGFGMRVCYYSRTPKPDFQDETGAQFCELDDLLAASNVVSVHVALTPDTLGLIGARQIGLMPDGAIIVNTARGGIVDENALLDGLQTEHLFAAGLDVFSSEPRVDRRLIDHPRVLCLPHTGSGTRETRSAMANLAARNVKSVLEGGVPVTPVSTSARDDVVAPRKRG